MKSWQDSIFKLPQRSKDALIIRLVEALNQEEGYYHMTDEQVYIEQCAFCGIETGD